MPAASDQAIVVRTWEFSETSQTACLFCREHGVLRVLAKGARRDKAPFSGGLEALTRGEAMVIAKRADALSTLTEWDLRHVYWRPRQTLSAHRAGLYLADLVYHAVTDHDPHPELFDALDRALDDLGAGLPGDPALLVFQWRLLVETGYAPRLDADAGSGRPLPDAPSYGFSPESGGVVPDPEGPRSGAEPAAPLSGPIWRVRAATVLALRELETSGAPPQDPSDEPDPTLERASRLLDAYLAFVLRKDPPTRALVFGAP